MWKNTGKRNIWSNNFNILSAIANCSVPWTASTPAVSWTLFLLHQRTSKAKCHLSEFPLILELNTWLWSVGPLRKSLGAFLKVFHPPPPKEWWDYQRILRCFQVRGTETLFCYNRKEQNFVFLAVGSTFPNLASLLCMLTPHKVQKSKSG